MKHSFTEFAEAPYKFKKMIEESLGSKAVNILSNPNFQQAAALGLLEFQDEDDQKVPQMSPEEMIRFFARAATHHDLSQTPSPVKRITNKSDVHSEVPNEDLESAYKHLFGTTIDKDPDFAHFFESEELQEKLQKKEKRPVDYFAHTSAQKKQQAKNIETAHDAWKWNYNFEKHYNPNMRNQYPEKPEVNSIAAQDLLKWHAIHMKGESVETLGKIDEATVEGSLVKVKKKYHYAHVIPMAGNKITETHFDKVKGRNVTPMKTKKGVSVGVYDETHDLAKNVIRKHLRDKHGMEEGTHYKFGSGNSLGQHIAEEFFEEAFMSMDSGKRLGPSDRKPLARVVPGSTESAPKRVNPFLGKRTPIGVKK